MIFIADAESGTSEKALYPLDKSVEYIDLEAVTGSPSFQDIVSTLVEVGDFEGAIVTDLMPKLNPKDYNFITELIVYIYKQKTDIPPLSAIENSVKSLSNLILENHIYSCVSDDLKKGNLEIIDELVSLFKRFNK